ncbi:MAG: hypothetical protein AAGF11_05365 [Myxococcota bacterium]
MVETSLVLKRAAVLIGLAGLGLGVYLWLVQDNGSTRSRRRREGGQPVRVIEAKEYPAVPRITGYGVVAAQQSWQGVAEVGGRVIEVDDRLQVGRIVREGTVLLKIDPEDLELEKTKSESSVRAVKAQIAELRAQEKGTKASLVVEKKVLALARKELDRTQGLYESDASSLAELETAEREVLAAEKAVIALENTLAESPASRRVLEAQLEQLEAGVTGAGLQLARTEVVAPFTMQIREVNATVGQAVSSSAILVVGDGVRAVEVTAKLPVGAIDPLLPARPDRPPRREASDTASTDAPTQPEPSATADTTPTPPPTPPTTPPQATSGRDRDSAGGDRPRRRRGRLDQIAEALEATVTLETTAVRESWPARFTRFAGIDEASRTLGVVVAVDEPRAARRKRRVRLSPGLHVEVELRGKPKPGCLALPTEAVHGDTVHVASVEDRLELRQVVLLWAQEDFVCVAEGLAAGDRVVTTPLSPAVAGMLLEPTVDEFEARRLVKLVSEGQPES